MEDMEIKGLLNSDQAEELFNKEAIMISERDAVPVARAVELLGGDAVLCVKLYANKYDGKGKDGGPLLLSWIALDGKTEVKFLTWPGFVLAVTYHNVFVQDERENPGKAVQA